MCEPPKPISYVLKSDISGFFNVVSHDWMIKFLRQRIGDEHVIRLIIRILKSDIMEDGLVRTSALRTPKRVDIVTGAVEHLPSLCAGFVVQLKSDHAKSWRGFLFRSLLSLQR